MKPLRRLTPGLRGRLLLSVLGAIAAVLAALTLAFNLVLADRLNHDADGVAQARASAELASLHVSRGVIVLAEAPDELSPDSQVWVFQGGRALEQPRTARANNTAAARLARRAPMIEDVSSTNTRLYALPVVQAGRRLGVVIAGVSLTPYAQTRRTALVASLILALVVLVAVGLAARWLIDNALHPVSRMTRQAAEWSEHDLDRRFAMGPAAGRAHATGKHPRRAARAARSKPAPRAAAVRRDLPRAADTAIEHHRRGAIRAAPRPADR